MREELVANTNCYTNWKASHDSDQLLITPPYIPSAAAAKFHFVHHLRAHPLPPSPAPSSLLLSGVQPLARLQPVYDSPCITAGWLQAVVMALHLRQWSARTAGNAPVTPYRSLQVATQVHSGLGQRRRNTHLQSVCLAATVNVIDRGLCIPYGTAAAPRPQYANQVRACWTVLSLCMRIAPLTVLMILLIRCITRLVIRWRIMLDRSPWLTWTARCYDKAPVLKCLA